ncbi:uncharacterized protein CTRU02_207817 [Colletotrichum truncatum]|uniref:Integral membrane protein n=1 Tax=Colletotrichum truncatum TaxID=5467 RepID=A0ACC3Z1X1_COLTU|nr:uncharacterized protein CTRU02_15161 [Colletotrichum truncatum]KAF6781378.1 integral membrane protein [Colletotrichum truncatum]
MTTLIRRVGNLEDPVPVLNKRPTILSITIVFLVAAWICGALRLYVRFLITSSPGWDDLFVILVLIFSSFLSTATIIATNYGLGHHFFQLGAAGMKNFIMSFYFCNAAYAIVTTLIKLALLFQYLRIYRRGTKTRLVIILTIMLTIVWGTAYTFLAWVPCIPVSAYWDLDYYTATRWGFGSRDLIVMAHTFESHVATNAILDVTVFLIPIDLFLRRGLEAKSRLSVLCLLFLGLSVNVVSLFRLISLVQSKAGTYPTFDPSWFACVPIVLATVEVDLATICASLPVFWPVLEVRLKTILITREFEVLTDTRQSNNESIESQTFNLSFHELNRTDSTNTRATLNNQVLGWTVSTTNTLITGGKMNAQTGQKVAHV